MSKNRYERILDAYMAAHPDERGLGREGYTVEPDGVWMHPNCLRRAVAWARAQRLMTWVEGQRWHTMIRQLEDQMTAWPEGKPREDAVG